MQTDVMTFEGDTQPGEPLIQSAMRNGETSSNPRSAFKIRERSAQQLARLPEYPAPLGTRPRTTPSASRQASKIGDSAQTMRSQKEEVTD